MEDWEEDEFDGPVKKFMYVNRKAPYGTVYALEGLEVVLITAAFDQDVSLVFIDDGVFQIKKGHNTKATGMKNFSPTYGVVEMEKEDADEDDDIDMVWRIVVEKESIEARGLSADDFVVDVEVLSSAELSDLMAEQEVVLSG